jgi:hypothetical protein
MKTNKETALALKFEEETFQRRLRWLEQKYEMEIRLLEEKCHLENEHAERTLGILRDGKKPLKIAEALGSMRAEKVRDIEFDHIAKTSEALMKCFGKVPKKGAKSKAKKKNS